MAPSKYYAGRYARRAEDDEEKKKLSEDEEKDTKLDDDLDAEDEDEDDDDLDAEDEDDDKTAEDDGDDGKDSGNDDNKKIDSRRSKGATARERRRCSALMRLDKQARNLGINFSVEKAITSGISTNMARKRIIADASNLDKSLNVSTVRPTASKYGGNRAHEKTKSMWQAAKQKKRKW